MANDVSVTGINGSVRRVRSEAEWQALMADYERWDGSQVSFCEARGVSYKTFQCRRRKRGGFVEIAAGSGPGWDVELLLGDGVVLRLRRS